MMLVMLFWFKKIRGQKTVGCLTREVLITYVLGGNGSHPMKSVKGRWLLFRMVRRSYGIGEVVVKLCNGRVRKLAEVRYVPKLERNLISLGRLDGLSYTVLVNNNSLEVTKKGSVILKGWKNTRNLFVLDGDVLVRGEALSDGRRCFNSVR